jgi:hypothetical protein
MQLPTRVWNTIYSKQGTFAKVKEKLEKIK